MNEKGFSWSRAWVVPNEPEAANKMTAVDWFLKMGSTVATGDEAINCVQEDPKGIGDQGNYIFADAEETWRPSKSAIRPSMSFRSGPRERKELWPGNRLTSEKMQR